MADIRINALANTATSAASDDYLALDGSANGTRKILATNVAQNVTDVTLGSAGPSVKSTLSARAPRQGLVFDGTSNSTLNVTTTGDFSFSAWVNIPSSVSSASQAVIDNGVGGVVAINGVSGFPSIVKAYADTITSTTAIAYGKWSFIAYTKSGTTGSWYVNGVASGTGTDTNTYSTWNRLGGSGYFGLTFTGLLSGPFIYNRALSASEVVALYEAGAPSGGDYASPAAGTAIITGDNSSFASDTGYWSKIGTATISGGTCTFAVSSQIYRFASISSGRRYRYTVKVDAISGGYLQYNDGNGVQNLTNTTGTVSVDFTSAGTTIGLATPAGVTATIDSITLVPLGLLLAPDAAQAGGGYVWNDQSGNLAQIVLPSSGVQWNLPSVATNRIRGTTSTNGNQQLLGASVLLPAECQITHVRARARSGTPTITIGTASGGAQIVASVALSTTWLNCTIALTGGIVSSADDIWVGSNSTDVVETDIAFQPLDF